MGMGQVKNNRGIPVTVLTYIYNGITATTEFEKETSIETSTVGVTHSNNFTHTYTSSHECGAHCGGTSSTPTYYLSDGTPVYMAWCTAGHVCGDNVNGWVSTCTATITDTKTSTDCAANTSHGTMKCNISMVNKEIIIPLNPTLSSATISGYSWTYTPLGGSATQISTTDSVAYQGLGVYTCAVTFYDNNSGSSSSHNFSQSFSLEITEYKKKRK